MLLLNCPLIFTAAIYNLYVLPEFEVLSNVNWSEVLGIFAVSIAKPPPAPSSEYWTYLVIGQPPLSSGWFQAIAKDVGDELVPINEPNPVGAVQTAALRIGE